MKHVVGISLGSSKRDHAVTINLLGQECRVERIGTDGDFEKLSDYIARMDGKVDAFGLGGIDLYVFSLHRRYVIRDAARLVKAAKRTPVVDGSGLKNVLERRAIKYLAEHTDLLKPNLRVLVMSAMDRFGMSQALEELGLKVMYGDWAFLVGLPGRFKSLRQVAFAASILAPIIVRLPFHLIYPTGEKQSENRPRYEKYFYEADLIAGDFHFIHRFIPPELPGRIVITNTVTQDDIQFLRERKIKTLVTTTPEMEGRSFGTNVIEALMVALSGNNRELTAEEYDQMITKLDFKPRIVNL
ncbi:MAG: quinate 5-dehydrogenase [Dethiobacteria bacterium]|jgi:hypothetical protein|nr:quinate 5-dehydrogenase [Bacillota bacterium]HOP69934.1 quinate 5-dehydrogenase [Bacillota bacterium]